MFSQATLKAHQADVMLQWKVAQAQKGLNIATRKLGGHLADLAVLELTDVAKLQKKIRREEKSLRPHIAEFKAQTQQWSEAIKEVDQALRELGDVENLLSVMKEEFDTVKKCAQGM